MPKVTVTELDAGEHPDCVRIEVEIIGIEFEVVFDEGRFGSDPSVTIITDRNYNLNPHYGKAPANVHLTV